MTATVESILNVFILSVWIRQEVSHILYETHTIVSPTQCPSGTKAHHRMPLLVNKAQVVLI